MLRHWKAYSLTLTCLFIAIGLDMLYPQITRIIVNDVFATDDLSRLPILLLAIVCIGLGRSVFGYCKEFTADKIGAEIGTEMRKDLFRHVQGLSVDYFQGANIGELMARIRDDVDQVRMVLGFIGMMAIEIIVHVISVLYCMFHLNWKLTFVPLFFMIVCAVVAMIMEKKLDKVYEDISEENARLTTVAEENLAGVRTVKAFAREDFEIKKFLSHNSRYYELNMNQSRIWVKYYPIFQFVGILLPITATVLGGFLVMKGEMDIGSLVAYVEYTRNCTWPMQSLGWITNDISRAIASQKKLNKIAQQATNMTEVDEPIILDEIKGEITFEHVDFSIDDKEILKDISFHVEQGKTLGIMGATGSGKSTIVNLIERFYDPTAGQVLLDGTNVKEMTFEQVRSSSAVVMQDVFLFSDTIEENIKMGKRDTIQLDEIRSAAGFAQARHFIEEMEEEYETVIGERGVGLSGGQKQRISIARAVSKHCPIIVMDDSTSALDMETEREIQKELEQLEGTTKIIIGHRISAVRHADEIIYLEEGCIAERGTHEELLEKKGLYYDTYCVQYGTSKLYCD
jgi:ATP-binding cassette subfamily B protein